MWLRIIPAKEILRKLRIEINMDNYPGIILPVTANAKSLTATGKQFTIDDFIK